MVFYLTYYIPSEYAYILSVISVILNVTSTDDAKWQCICSKMFTKLGSKKADFVKEQKQKLLEKIDLKTHL